MHVLRNECYLLASCNLQVSCWAIFDLLWAHRVVRGQNDRKLCNYPELYDMFAKITAERSVSFEENGVFWSSAPPGGILR